MKKMLELASIATIMAFVPQVKAGEFFIGATAGTANFSGLNEACDDFIEDSPLTAACTVTDDSDNTFGINAGYNFNDYFGVEAGYMDLGEYTATLSVARITGSFTAEADISYAGLVVTAPLSDRFSVSLRAGGVNANAEVSSGPVMAEIEDETTGFVGASADFRITDNVSVQLRYDDLDLVDITSVGIRYHF